MTGILQKAIGFVADCTNRKPKDDDVGTNAVLIAGLQLAIREIYECGSIHIETTRVRHVSGGKTVFDGNVEVFGLKGHREAKLAYAWLSNEPEPKPVIVLGIPPVYSPESAVRFKLTAAGDDAPGTPVPPS